MPQCAITGPSWPKPPRRPADGRTETPQKEGNIHRMKSVKRRTSATGGKLLAASALVLSLLLTVTAGWGAGAAASGGEASLTDRLLAPDGASCLSQGADCKSKDAARDTDTATPTTMSYPDLVACLGDASGSAPAPAGALGCRRLLAAFKGDARTEPGDRTALLQADPGQKVFAASCAGCHTLLGGEHPLLPRLAGKSREEVRHDLDRLAELQPDMPPLAATAAQKDDLARFLFREARGGL